LGLESESLKPGWTFLTEWHVFMNAARLKECAAAIERRKQRLPWSAGFSPRQIACAEEEVIAAVCGKQNGAMEIEMLK
jgi:hypothetical protein